MIRKNLIEISLAIFVLASCSVDAEQQRPRPLAGPLQPYQSPVPSSTPLPPTAIATAIPSPTATPFIYIVAQGDTMLDIAFQLGISPENLAAANPDLSPSAMSVGQELRIPEPSEVPSVEATPVPVDVSIAEPNCFATITQGLWCFALVTNPHDVALENISAEIKLSHEEGDVTTKSKMAFLPLGVLGSGESLPLFVFFPNVDASVQPSAQLMTAMKVPADDERFIYPILRNTLTQVDWSGRSAHVSGEVFIPPATGDVDQVWVAATAFDELGHVVGVRRWEFGDTVVAGASANFQITVASLGPEIVAISLGVEAKP